MSLRNLERLFHPTSIAVIGASTRPGRAGSVIMRNLLEGGFSGPIMPVNLRHRAVGGVLAYKDVASLPEIPDLAVICTPPSTVPDLVAELGQLGTRAVVAITGGYSHGYDAGGQILQDRIQEAAKRHGVRVLGPNCLGLLVPRAGLNASFSHIKALPGRIAFVGQSAGVCTTMLDWAHPRGIGFSHCISLGDCADLDFGDVLDYLSHDPHTQSILLYIESMEQRGNFMSAARAAARSKPVLCIKGDRMRGGAKAAASHTGALVTANDVYDAAFRRAGMLRVYYMHELFGAVETLAGAKPMKGERLAVLTNDQASAVLVVDELLSGGGRLAELSPETLARLEAVLPPAWSKANPVDILIDARGERYAAALEILAADEEIDGIMVLHAPNGVASPIDAAEAIIGIAGKKGRANVLAAWLGEESVAPARKLLTQAGVPTYDSASRATRAFLHVVNYNRNHVMLMEAPPSAPTNFTPATATARLLVEKALAAGDGVLSEPDSKLMLAAYGIPTVETHIAPDIEAAMRIAQAIGFPIALSILSPNVVRKWDVGGLALNLDSAEALGLAAAGMVRRVRRKIPDARIDGFTLQRMVVNRPDARQLIVGVTTDAIFGPVILFGEGGRSVETIRDHAIGLPPLNVPLARELISRTRISQQLQRSPDRPAADLDAISLTLTQVSQMIVDIPEIVELDIHPLFADDRGVLAVGAHIRLAPLPASPPDSRRLAIRPYPKSLEEIVTLKSGERVLIRPIRPEDEPAHFAFMGQLRPEDIRFRFFGFVHAFQHSQMARLTQIDYDREMAFIATRLDPQGPVETLGVVRTVSDPDNTQAEFSMVVRSDLKGLGLGRQLMEKMMRYCKARRTHELVGQILPDNRNMLRLCTSLGFRIRLSREDETMEARYRLFPEHVDSLVEK